MSDTERLAIAAHLHVLLRRNTGRVTDTEWMAHNAEYAAEIVRFARARAAEQQQPDLAEWAARLEQAMAQAAGQAPTVRPLVDAVRERLQPPQAAAPPGVAAGPSAPRYVGGIR